MSCCNDYNNILYNFISPITGRVLADYNYVLVGNKQGIAIPSPILIDIRLDLIALRSRFNTLVEGDILIGHPNDQLPNAQVMADLDDGFLYNTEGIISTNALIPIESLPNLLYQNIWIGDITDRPTPQQRVGLINLPSFTSLNPLNNYGLFNLYTGQFSVTSPLEASQPAITQRVNMSNLPLLSKGKLWIGAINYIPPVITFDSTPPYIHVTGSLNWNPPSLPPGDGDAVPTEIGLNPGEIFIGNSTPGFAGQITTTTSLLPSNLPDLPYRKIWRGDLSNRPIEVSDLTLLEGKVSAIENTIIGIQGSLAQLEVQFGALQLQLGALDTAVGLLGLEVQAIASTVAALVLTVAGLVATVAALGITVTALEVQVTNLSNRTLDQVPLAVNSVNLNNQRITNLANPINALDAVNLQSLNTVSNKTLDQIPLAVADVNINNHKLTNVSDATNSLDAVNLQTMTAAINTSGSILSILGTTNQITANTVSRVTTLSLPASVVLTTSITAGNLQATTNTLQSTNANGVINVTPNGNGNIILGSSGSTGRIGIKGTPSYTLDVLNGTTRTNRLIGNSTILSVVKGANNVVGTGSAVAYEGTELGGYINVLTGGSGITTSGRIGTFTLASATPNGFSIVISPANLSAATATIYTSVLSTSSFSLESAVVLSGSLSYLWAYQIIVY